MSDTIKSLAKEMGDAGYCNYAACEEFLTRCWEASAREQMAQIDEALQSHWLNSIECIHIIHSDVSHCACGWKSAIQPSVGNAVKRWFEHVRESFEREAVK